MKGGFKILINNRVEHCNRFTVDYDAGLFWKDKPNNNDYEGESFDPKKFAVMTVTRDDMEEK